MLSHPPTDILAAAGLAFDLHWDFPAEEMLAFVAQELPLHHQFDLEKEKKNWGKMKAGPRLNPEQV